MISRHDGIFDTVVIGAGFGGLGAALTLTEKGARVYICETLKYPGGCASTFERGGARFDAGATLLSGFGPGQLFDQWARRYQFRMTTEWHEPVVRMISPNINIQITRDRASVENYFLQIPGAPREKLRRFFQFQRKMSDALWRALDDPQLLPPLSAAAMMRHLVAAPGYLPILTIVGKPFITVLEKYQLAGFAPLREYLDALCQITVQCPAAEAEAPFALAAMDYYFRGAANVRGGVGVLAAEILGAIVKNGGVASLANRAISVERERGIWRVETRRGTVRARSVIANILPQNINLLFKDAGSPARARIERLAARVEESWGAGMIYAVAREGAGASTGAAHTQIIQNPNLPFHSGNHLFVSISPAGDPGRAPAGMRTLTASTHVRMDDLLKLDEAARGAAILKIQESMRKGIQQFLPDWSDWSASFTASPRTFERFTGRRNGYVGGVPRRAGLHHYQQIGPARVDENFYLVGDSVFPGQSALAVAIGGCRAAEKIINKLS